MAGKADGSGAQDDPWRLKTPPGKSEYRMWKDEQADPPALVCQVGGAQLRYDLRAIDDLRAMLRSRGGWVARGGWHGLKKGLRGRFGVHLPRFSKRSASPKSRTKRGTTRCGRSERRRPLRREACRRSLGRDRRIVTRPREGGSR